MIIVAHERAGAGMQLTANEARYLANVLNATAKRVEGSS